MRGVHLRVAVPLLLSLLLAGCGGDRDFTNEEPVSPSEISHALTGGTEGFFFLPPLAPDSQMDGTPDPTLASDLRVDVVDFGDPDQPVVASFTDESDSNTSETIRLSDDGTHYVVNFHTDLYPLTEGSTYRIFVRRDSDDAEYGFADAVICRNVGQARRMLDEEDFALKDGRTLPIKFRIEEDAEPPGPPLSPEQMIFQTNRDGNDEIYAMDSDGTGKVNLTNNPASDSYGSLSPDRKKIAVARLVSGQRQIYVVDITTGEESCRTTLGGHYPSWSPSGDRLVFQRPASGGGLSIVDAEGPPEANLTVLPVQSGSFHPAWSPDGNRIAYKVGGSNVGAIWIIDLATYEKTLIEDGPGDDAHPQWSQDGTAIAFASRRTGTYKVYIKSLDDLSQPPWPLTASAGWSYPEHVPSYSPDGTRIAFASNMGNQENICVINADGSGEVDLLTTSTAHDTKPDW